MSTKRPRLPSISSSSSVSTQSPTPKASRTNEAASTTHPLLCSLPPTCNHNPTPIANTRDLEIHYANYHAHVCEEPGCRCVFPEARLLELVRYLKHPPCRRAVDLSPSQHQTECHDPLAAVRKERGEKIFGCFLGSCNKIFLTPKARRLHLIQGHHYPKEYFFAVTNKGVGGLLKKWGEGASMIRGEWKRREEGGNDDSNDEGVTNDDAEEVDEGASNEHLQLGIGQNVTTEDTLGDLAESMSSLSLVPAAVRFGRGGKSGFVKNGGHVAASSRGHGQEAGRGSGQTNGVSDDIDVDMNGAGRAHVPVRGRGIYRGRAGKARGIPNGDGRGRSRGRGRGRVSSN